MIVKLRFTTNIFTKVLKINRVKLVYSIGFLVSFTLIIGIAFSREFHFITESCIFCKS